MPKSPTHQFTNKNTHNMFFTHIHTHSVHTYAQRYTVFCLLAFIAFVSNNNRQNTCAHTSTHTHTVTHTLFFLSIRTQLHGTIRHHKRAPIYRHDCAPTDTGPGTTAHARPRTTK